MLKLEFTTDTIDALHYERFHHPHPRVQLKMEVLYLKSQQLPHQQICSPARVSGNTLRAYLREYQAGGVAQLKQLNFHQPQSALETHRESLAEHFTQHPPASVKQAQAVSAEQTGIERSPIQVRAFLLRLGMKCRKVGMMPAKADTEKQAEFLAQQLEPRLAEAQAGERAGFFLDSAHFVLGPVLGWLWSFTRWFSSAERAATLQRAGCAQCRHARRVDGHQ